MMRRFFSFFEYAKFRGGIRLFSMHFNGFTIILLSGMICNARVVNNFSSIICVGHFVHRSSHINFPSVNGFSDSVVSAGMMFLTSVNGGCCRVLRLPL